MPEQALEIPAGEVTLEARYRGRGSGPAVAISHPHPLYGGSMSNNVVKLLRDRFGAGGVATLRFNFRSVGQSSGSFARGQGESQDLAAAMAELETRGHAPVHLAGYSFGAWVSLLAVAAGLGPTSLVLVAPPLSFVDFEGLALPDCPGLIVVGDADNYCSVPKLRKWLDGQAARKRYRLEVLAVADHFFGGAEEALQKAVDRFIKKSLAAT